GPTYGPDGSGFGATDGQSALRVEEVQLGDVHPQVDLRTGLDLAAWAHSGGEQRAVGAQGQGTVCIFLFTRGVLCQSRGVLVAHRRGVDAEDHVDLGSQFLGDLGGHFDARLVGAVEVGVVEVRGTDTEDE